MRLIAEPVRQIPIVAEADVLVIGGGPSGIAAALSAARNGARTALVERYGFLGGMATAALVGPFAGVRLKSTNERIVGGIPWELIQRLQAHGGALIEQGYWDVPFDPEVLKWELDSLAVEAGLRLRYHSLVVEVLRDEGHIRAVLVESKSGRQAIAAKVFVDATGDADIAAWAGASFEVGRGDGALQPMTLAFRLGNVDTDQLGDIRRPYVCPDIRQKAQELTEQGRLPQFGGPWTFWGSTFRKGEVFVNMVRLWGDATQVETLTANEIAGRANIQRFIRFLRESAPAFRNCVLLDSGPQIGVRETRRIVGEYKLTASDLRAGRRFADSIALGGHVIDIHSPTGTSGQTVEDLPAYQIPYRCLLPLGVDNLLVCGRPISASHEAHASLRVMGTCMATGEAAGVAAALAATRRLAPRQVDSHMLRSILAAQGALIDDAVPEQPQDTHSLGGSKRTDIRFQTSPRGKQ